MLVAGFPMQRYGPIIARGVSRLMCVAAALVCNGTALAASVPGHVEAWGDYAAGQSTPPSGLEDIVAIAAGGAHSLALRSNGTVVGWGENSEGQATIPPGLANVAAISAAGHSVALKRDGTVSVWGNNNPAVTTVPPGATGLMAISAGNAAGNSYTLAVRSNGTVIAWGIPSSSSTTNVPAGLAGVIAVAAGNNHALALKSDGTVIAWGDNFAGAATPPPGLMGVIAVRAGQFTSFAIKSDGTVVGWGAAVVPPGLTGIIDLQDGAMHTIALRTNRQVVAWGLNHVGQATVPEGLSDVTAIAAGGNHNLALTPRPLILSLSPSTTANIGDTVSFSLSATAGPLTYQWQHNGANLEGATNASITLTNVQAADAGIYRVLVRNSYGSVLSTPIWLTFPPPIITTQPQSVTRYRGESVSFSVGADGIQPLSYQWRRDGTNIQGANTATLTLPGIRTTNTGGYDVVITDAAGGSVTSSTATLTVIDPTVAAITLTPSVDTSIYSSGTKPLGTGSILAGRRNITIVDRALLRFNLNTISAGTVIQSARLQLTVIRIPPGAANSDFSLHRMLRSWDVDASWTSATAGSTWASAGASAGADFVATPTATRFISGTGPYDFGPSSQLTADIQSWINDPAANHGWLLKSENETSPRTARHFGSSETSEPPRLLLGTTAPSPVLVNPQLTGSIFTFQFTAAPGWIYRIESQSDLGASWSTLTNAEAGAASNPILISVPRAPSRQFYRVLAE